MNTNSNENDNSNNVEIEEVQPLEDNATDEQKKDYYDKLESNNKQLYARLKKKDGFVQDKDGKWVKPTPAAQKPEAKPDGTIKKETSELTGIDTYALIKADVHKDDVETVIKFAKFNGVSVADALNDEMLKSMLDKKTEVRKTAEGTNTAPAKRGNGKISDEALIENAEKGKMPENDDDMKRLTILMRKRG